MQVGTVTKLLVSHWLFASFRHPLPVGPLQITKATMWIFSSWTKVPCFNFQILAPSAIYRSSTGSAKFSIMLILTLKLKIESVNYSLQSNYSALIDSSEISVTNPFVFWKMKFWMKKFKWSLINWQRSFDGQADDLVPTLFTFASPFIVRIS